MSLPELDTEVLGNIVALSEGSLEGLSTIHRSGDSHLSTGETEWVSVQAGLSFSRLSASYEIGVEPAGAELSVLIELCDTEARFQLSISAKTLKARLDRFEITDMGDVTVDTKDFSLGFLLDPLINSIIKLLKTKIAAVISKALFNTMREALGDMDLNATIKSID
ncbi:uncharacterized protein LOC122388263 isoform X2 [Amphibalanus amphitrite]|nr:uncharacterized protein LOC122388263 isoform X2 [Amphibalanus amphitrite]